LPERIAKTVVHLDDFIYDRGVMWQPSVRVDVVKKSQSTPLCSDPTYTTTLLHVAATEGVHPFSFDFVVHIVSF
jgi:hypothetical protein